MRRSRLRQCALRWGRFEPLEPRLVMSGQPPFDFALDYFVESASDIALQPALTDVHELSGLTAARAAYGFTGAGQTVAVIDSGIA